VTRSIAFLPAAAVLVAALSGPAFSQGAPQTLSLMKVDPQSVATGYRTSKVVGSTVFNDPTGLRPFDARLDPSGKTLYVVDYGGQIWKITKEPSYAHD